MKKAWIMYQFCLLVCGLIHQVLLDYINAIYHWFLDDIECLWLVLHHVYEIKCFIQDATES